MWVARNKIGKLEIFSQKPRRDKVFNEWIASDYDRCPIMEGLLILANIKQPEWEDGPIEIELTKKTKPYIIGENLVDYLSCPEHYPQKQPENFYLNKATYTDNYFNIIRNCAMDNYVIIHCDLDKETSQVESVYIDSVATLERFWNNEFKKIYDN